MEIGLYLISLIDPRGYYWKQHHKEIPDKIQDKQDHQLILDLEIKSCYKTRKLRGSGRGEGLKKWIMLEWHEHAQTG